MNVCEELRREETRRKTKTGPDELWDKEQSKGFTGEDAAASARRLAMRAVHATRISAEMQTQTDTLHEAAAALCMLATRTSVCIPNVPCKKPHSRESTVGKLSKVRIAPNDGVVGQLGTAMAHR